MRAEVTRKYGNAADRRGRLALPRHLALPRLSGRSSTIGLNVDFLTNVPVPAAEFEAGAAADQVGVEEFALGPDTREARQLRHERLERRRGFEPCERGAEAEVRAEAEGDVAARVALDVEAVRLREVALVAIGRAEQHHHERVRREHLRAARPLAWCGG